MLKPSLCIIPISKGMYEVRLAVSEEVVMITVTDTEGVLKIVSVYLATEE